MSSLSSKSCAYKHGTMSMVRREQGTAAQSFVFCMSD